MAYKSDVRIVVSKKGYKELEKFSNEYLSKFEDMDKEDNMLYQTDIKHENINSIYLGWNSTKWYEYSKFHDIDAIMQGLDYLKENDFSFRYARFGESIDDIEENNYESQIEEEQDLVFPLFQRKFDDEYVINQINTLNNFCEENEIKVDKELSEKKELKIKLLGYDDFDYATYIDENGRYYKNISFENETADLYYGSFNDYDCEPSSRVPDNYNIVVVKEFDNEVEL